MIRDSSSDMYEKAEDLFKNIPKAEIEAWAKHPITKALRLTLYGDMVGHFEGWMNGEFTGPSTDETIQKNSKALGAVGAVETIITWVDDAERGDLYD